MKGILNELNALLLGKEDSWWIRLLKDAIQGFFMVFALVFGLGLALVLTTAIAVIINKSFMSGCP